MVENATRPDSRRPQRATPAQVRDGCDCCCLRRCGAEAQPVVVSLQKKGIMFEIHLDEEEEEDIEEQLEVQKKEHVKLVEV